MSDPELEVFTVHCTVNGKDVDDTKFTVGIACTFGPFNYGDFQTREFALGYAVELAKSTYTDVCAHHPEGQVDTWVSSNQPREWSATRHDSL